MPGLENLLTEQPNPASASIDTLPTEAMLRVINAEDQKVAPAVEREIPAIARAVDATVAAFENGGRLFYIGAGTSGRLGVLDASECPPTFSVPPEMVQGIIAGGHAALTRSQEGAEDRVEGAVEDLEAHGVRAGDFVIGIAASGTTPYVRRALEYARTLPAATGLVACSHPPKDTLDYVDILMLPITGPEVVTGSTRMKAGTATKLVLNTITTGAMIRLGKTYGNLMVDVQTGSEKHRDRAHRIVSMVTSIGYEEADKLLRRAKWNVKVAIVMQKSGLDYSKALSRLRKAHDFVADAIGEEAGPRLK
jgi:N-acetylmuramic acid 6-phosphate etherase